MTLDELTQGLRERLGDNPNLGATIKFDFGDEGAIFVDGTVNPPVVTTGGGDAQCNLTLSKDDFETMAKGGLDPTMAYMTGRLKVDDIATAMRIGAFLR
jgi:putative sterol carrier protein